MCEAPCRFLSMKPFSAFRSPPRLSPYVLSWICTTNRDIKARLWQRSALVRCTRLACSIACFFILLCTQTEEEARRRK